MSIKRFWFTLVTLHAGFGQHRRTVESSSTARDAVRASIGSESKSDRIEFTRPGRFLVWTVYAACESGLDRDEHDDVPRPATLYEGPLVSNLDELTVSPRP